MAVTPSGSVSLPLSYARTQLANCSAFQTWTGTASVAAALAKIYVVVATTGYTLPVAVIEWNGDFGYEISGRGTRNFYDQTGSLNILFRGSVDSDHNEFDAAMTFTNSIGAIVEDFNELSGQAGYLDVDNLTMNEFRRPEDDEKETYGDFYETSWTVMFTGIS